MYSTCLFCNASLGVNEVIESFPVGRRLAFDAARGRLWVVCRRCERWNLTPLEERWEAIETCERLFTETRLRVSTDNIGLARLREGLELVRIGNPLRPEMAAWRYGDQFGRRRRRHLMLTGAGIAALGGIVTAGVMSGVLVGGGWGLFNAGRGLVTAYRRRRVRTHLRVPHRQEPIPIRGRQLERARLLLDGDEWALRIDPAPRRRWEPGDDDAFGGLIFRGPDALVAAGKLLPAINASGARAAEVQDAVSLVTEAASPDALFARYAGSRLPPSPRRWRSTRAATDALVSMPAPVRLALEMAAHEEQERRALEGELALLEAAWRDAEEVAQISDDMFLPDGITERVEALRKKA